jgi:hypothetical protein
MDIIYCPGLARQQASYVGSVLRTIITGQRSLAEIYAKDVLSAVEDGAATVSRVKLLRWRYLQVFVSYSILR